MKETTRRWLTGVPSTYDGSRVTRVYRPLDLREDGRGLLHPVRTLRSLPKRDSGRPDLAETWLLFQQYWRILRITKRDWHAAIAVNLIVYIGAIAQLDLGTRTADRLQGVVILGIGLAISYLLTILMMVRARRLASGDYEGRFYVSQTGDDPPESPVS